MATLEIKNLHVEVKDEEKSLQENFKRRKSYYAYRRVPRHYGTKWYR